LDTTVAGHHLYLSSYTLFHLIINPLVVILLGYYMMRREGLKTHTVLLFLTSLSIVVIVLSRVAHYLLNQDYYLENGISLYNLSASGFTMFGGFILAIPFLLLFAWLVRFSAGRLFDLITPGWALGIFFNKIGCLFTGCCFGQPTSLPWGLIYPADSLPYQYFRTISATPGGELMVVTPLLKLAPVQVYESLIGLLGFALSLVLLKKKLPPGLVFLGFAALFSGSRLGTHYIRANPNMQDTMTIPLLYLGCTLLAGGLAVIILRRKQNAYRSIAEGSCEERGL
jgi:phosphatidylglycerol:prolipoprotein diacylglycerol transferase